MKIIKENKENIDERFDNAYQRKKHYDSHVTKTGKSNSKNNRLEYDNEFSTEQYADELAYETAAENFAFGTVPQGSELDEKNPHPVGFMGEKGRVHLYDPRTKEFTLYKIENGEIITISYYLMRGDDRYEKDKENWYVSEIPKDYNKQVTKRGTHAK